jgi:hypothetical protein
MANVIPFDSIGPWVMQKKLMGVRTVQEYIWSTAEHWKTAAEEALEFPYASLIPPEPKEKLHAFSTQLITAQQSFEEAEKQLRTDLDCCQRCQPGELFYEHLSTGELWVCSRMDPAHSRHPLKDDVVYAIKSWDDLTWQWVSASFCAVFGVEDAPSSLVGKTPKTLWGEHAI